MRVDAILALDMLLSARDAFAFASEVSKDDFEHDRMRQLAVIKSIETIGEAAARVSEGFRNAHPEIPWRDIVAMRNRLVHGYFELDLDRVRATALNDLPPLVRMLEALTLDDGAGVSGE